MPVPVPIEKSVDRIQGDRTNTLAKVGCVNAKTTMHRSLYKIPEPVADEVLQKDDEDQDRLSNQQRKYDRSTMKPQKKPGPRN